MPSTRRRFSWSRRASALPALALWLTAQSSNAEEAPEEPATDAATAAQLAPEPESTPPTAQVPMLVASQLAALGCSLEDVRFFEERYYAACGEGAVWVMQTGVDGSLQVLSRHQVSGVVRSLVVRDGQVWVSAVHETEQPVLEAPSQAAPSSAQPVPPAAASPKRASPPVIEIPDWSSGTVLSAQNQVVSVSIGSGLGVRNGDHVEIYRLAKPRGAASQDGDEPVGFREETVLVGEVLSTSDMGARVAVGFGEWAEPGMRARKTQRALTARPLAPARVPHVTIVEGAFRPSYLVGSRDAALLGEFAVTALPERNLYLRVEAKPLGVLLHRDNLPMFGTYASAGYDQTYFALGFGTGTLQRTRESTAEPVLSVPVVTATTDLKLGLLQHARVGSRDGLHVVATSIIRLNSSTRELGWLEVAAQVPLDSRSWFQLRGTLGTAPDYVLGELCFRRLIRGNGGKGSWFLRPSVGISAFRTSATPGLGPLLGLHVEARLAP